MWPCAFPMEVQNCPLLDYEYTAPSCVERSHYKWLTLKVKNISISGCHLSFHVITNDVDIRSLCFDLTICCWHSVTCTVCLRLLSWRLTMTGMKCSIPALLWLLSVCSGRIQKHTTIVQEMCAPFTLLLLPSLFLSLFPLSWTIVTSLPSPLWFLRKGVCVYHCQKVWKRGFCFSHSPRCAFCALSLSPTVWGVAMNQTKYSSWQQMPLLPLSSSVFSLQHKLTGSRWTGRSVVLTDTHSEKVLISLTLSYI